MSRIQVNVQPIYSFRNHQVAVNKPDITVNARESASLISSRVQTTMSFAILQNSLFDIHSASKNIFHVSDMNFHASLITLLISSSMLFAISRIQPKFVSRASYSSTSAAIIATIGNITGNIAEESNAKPAEIIGNTNHNQASAVIKPVNAVATIKIVADSCGFFCTKSPILLITGVIASTIVRIIGAKLEPSLIIKLSKDPVKSSTLHLRLSSCVFAILSVVPPLFSSSFVNSRSFSLHASSKIETSPYASAPNKAETADALCCCVNHSSFGHNVSTIPDSQINFQSVSKALRPRSSIAPSIFFVGFASLVNADHKARVAALPLIPLFASIQIAALLSSSDIHKTFAVDPK